MFLKHHPFKTSIAFVFIIILTNCSFVTLEAEKFEKSTFLASDGFILNYQILLPHNYDAQKAYPLVLFLHGAGERGEDNEKQLLNGVKVFTTAQNKTKFPCIVIAPQCPIDSYWASVEIDRSTYPLKLSFDYSQPSKPPLNAAIELVNQLITQQAADKSQIYIAGLSMGGMGTFEAVYKHPDLFASAVAVCGGGDEARFSKEMAQVPFWVFHGDADAVVGVDNSREAVESLKSLGTDVKYTEYSGINHNSWDNAFAEPDLLNWMFSKRK